ncbi:MAG: nucleoside hydrolase [Chloroflexota bacterium]|jgi:purine nucleosidase
MADTPMPLILDVDTGIDDSLALLYALGSPEADVMAVTCVSGNVEARQVAINTLALLELAGRTDIEVAVGREVPLERPLETTPETHGPRGIGYAELPAPQRAVSDRNGIDVIVEAAREHPGEIMLVTLGPLTNLAVALEREPRLPRLLRRHVLMGGAFGASGNTTPTSEWNLHCDPEAAKIAFRAWAEAIAKDPSVARPVALGLDVTEGARIGTEHVVALAHRAGSKPDERRAAVGDDPLGPRMSVASNPVIRFIADALRWYYEFHERYDGFYGAFIHDPLAVAAALDPGLIMTEALYVDVETRGELTTGMTVADRRGLTGKPPNIDVAATADIGRFLDRLIERIGGLAAERGDADAIEATR